MIIGVPKEIKVHEYRVGLVPAGAAQLARAGHRVLVESGAGLGSGLQDAEYAAAGAELAAGPEEVYDRAEMVLKVKEPLPPEYGLLRQGQILFTYLHLAPAPELAQALAASGCTGVAYETIQLPDGSLPLLTPMSEVAGRMAAQVGASYLTKSHGGRGVLLGGVPGVERGTVTIIGAGVVGSNAAKIAIGMGARVYLVDVNQQRLALMDDVYGGLVDTVMSSPENIARLVAFSDVVIGSVLIVGARAPWLVSREMVAGMSPGSVVVDVAIDQGGCFETSRPTTHDEPVYVEEGVTHYCVANMPGNVARTSTFALTNVTLPRALAIANLGLAEAVRRDPPLALGVNVCRGRFTHPAVAQALGRECREPLECLEG
jgi:alanine dehydrogenase